MDDKLISFCQSRLSSYKVEGGYITGYIDGDQEYEDFFKLLNSQCSGFVKRNSGTKKYVFCIVV